MDKQHLEVEQSHQLRGIAILMILLVHSINEYPAYEAQWSKWLLIPEWGELACSIFFLLSGYGLTISMQKAQGREHKFCYWMSKIRKLIVPFLFAYLLTVVALSLYDGKYGSYLPAGTRADVFNYASRLFQWRKTSDAVINGRFMHFLTRDNTYAYFRYTDNDTVFVYLNNSSEPKQIPWSDYAEIAGGLKTGVDIISGQTVDLSNYVVPAHSSLVVDF